MLLTAVHAGNPFPRKSPVSGTVFRFGIRTGAAEEVVAFRLAETDGTFPGKERGAGTGPAVSLATPGTYEIPANLPIKAGDFVGVDTYALAAYSTSCASASSGGFTFYHPPLVDGGPYQAADANSACELLVNAVVEPANKFVVAPLKLKKKKGIALLTLTLPNPGSVSLAGPGVMGLQRTLGSAGPLTLPIKPAKKGKKARRLRGRLRQKGKANVKVWVTYVPTGGSADTELRKAKLVLMHRR